MKQFQTVEEGGYKRVFGLDVGYQKKRICKVWIIIMRQQKFVTSVAGIGFVAEGGLHVSKLCEDPLY